MFDIDFWLLMGKGVLESVYMTLVATACSYIIGLPLGVLLFISKKDGIRPLPALCGTVGVIVNLMRSVPFIIMLVALIPVTRFITGTSLGSTATIVPLVIGAAPFVARLCESSFMEISVGVIEAARSMGTTTWQLITRVLLPEAKPSLLSGAAIATTTILGYSAMAGFVGGGGLGAIAINYGYYRYDSITMLITCALLVVLVQLMQSVGSGLARKTDKRLK